MTEDPKTTLSRFETSGDTDSDQKTRMESRQLLQACDAFRLTAKALGDDFSFYADHATQLERLMMSHKGRRSDDIRDMFISQRDGKEIDTGHQPLREHLRSRDANRQSGQ